jgi:hypothetical protein
MVTLNPKPETRIFTPFALPLAPYASRIAYCLTVKKSA